MCGIFGYIGSRTDAANVVLEGLKKLEYRGYDSWGVAIVPNGRVIARIRQLAETKQSLNLPARLDSAKRAGETGIASPSGRSRDDNAIVVKKKAGKIGGATVDDMPTSSFAFGHTRWATHGGVTDKNAHPHLDCHGRIAVIHNGIFENYETFKENLVKKGHRFISDTDTEVIAHQIEEYTKTMTFAKAVQKTFQQMEGLNAIIVMMHGEDRFVAIRNGSPLVVGFGHGENFLASDPSALLSHTKQVHYLEDNEMAIMGKHAIMLFDALTGDHKAPKKQTLNWTVTQAEKGNYPYFMLKEIHEQPGIVAEIASQASTHVEKLAELIRKAHGTYMVGCGTASYACIAGSYLFSKIAKRHVNHAIGSEFGYHEDFISKKSLVIALSQSGETIDILEGVKKAKSKGATIAAITNVLGSSLYREAHFKLLLGVGPEKGVASTKAFIGKLSYLTLLAYALAGNLASGKKVLLAAAKSAKAVLAEKNVKRITALAKMLKRREHIYVIGRGLSYPASLETALKIKEISYIHAEGFAAGELKHGVIALIEKGAPCIAFLPNDETYGANLAGAMEMKARGGYIIGISYKPHEVFDYFLPVADAMEATIIPNVITAQLLAYYLTIEKGLDPDMPRNLAKSVTVK